MEIQFEGTNRYVPVIDAKLSEFLGAQTLKTGHAISRMTQYHFETGGKRLRALIPVYFFECFGLEATQVLPFSCCVEMIHNATLVHDDLQDGDEMRRGRETVWKKFSIPQSINCGDAMFQYPFLILDEMNISAELKWQLALDGVKATLKVIEGQAQEFIMKEEAFPGIDRYLGVVRGKTADLFNFSVMGALQIIEEKTKLRLPMKLIEEHVLSLGTLFQIQDDVLDVYADKGRDMRATDIAEGKVSILIAYAYENGSIIQKDFIRKILTKGRVNVTSQDINAVVEILDGMGAKDYALNHMQKIIRGISEDQFLQQEAPQVYQGLLRLSDVFLKPIANLMAGKA